MGNDISIQPDPTVSPVRQPVSRVPARLRRAHPHAFDPHTLCLGQIHLDDDWNESFDSKSHSILASLSKPDLDFKPDELWNAIVAHLHKAQPISTIFQRRIPENNKDANLFKFLETVSRAVKIVGDSVYLTSCFLADLQTSPTTFPTKYGTAAVNDAVKLDNQLPLELVRAVVAELPSVLKAIASEKRKNSGKTTEGAASEPEMFRVRLSSAELPRAVESFCRFYSPFQQPESLSLDSGTKKSLLHCLHATVSGEFEPKVTETGMALAETTKRDCPTVKEMVRAGIRFEPKRAKSIADIRFEDGVLQLPVLVLNDETETVMRNLTVLEASFNEKPVSEYIQLLTAMVENGQDVAVLRKAGLLQGYFGRDETVAEFIKSLDDSYFIRPYYFPPIQKALENLLSYYDERKESSKMVSEGQEGGGNRSAASTMAGEGKEGGGKPLAAPTAAVQREERVYRLAVSAIAVGIVVNLLVGLLASIAVFKS